MNTTPTTPSLRIATWNVNSLNVRLPQVLQWLAENPVDVLCLQELKLVDEKFPHAELTAIGYAAQAFGQKTYNGVAILSRLPLHDTVRNIPGFADEQARVISATVDAGAQGEIRIINGYFVNGQEPGSDKFQYKMQWLEHLHALVREQLRLHPRLVLLGDFNITPDDRDTWDPVGLKDTIHHTVEERAAFQSLQALGLHDAFRLFPQAEKSFSWWDYRMLGFQKNRGLRIDHILISNALQASVTQCSIDRTPRKYPKPSDHAPVIVTLG